MSATYLIICLIISIALVVFFCTKVKMNPPFFLFQDSEQFFPLRGKLAEVGFQNDVRRDAWVGYSMQPGEFLFEVQDGA